MSSHRFLRSLPALVLILSLPAVSKLQAQGAKQHVAESSIADSDADHIKQRDQWFFRGRIVPGWPSAELRRRAYQAKLRMRAQRAAVLADTRAMGQAAISSTPWTSLGPVPLASDATGNGTQNYDQVSGRATAVAIDPADSTGNTVYIAGAQGGIWKSTNAANSTANSVTWTPLTDDQATLSFGAIAIQPGNSNPANTVILAATGEADNSADSYFGLGILNSTDAGNTWTLVSTANGGNFSFSGLGGTRMAFSSVTSNTVVAAMATSSEGLIDGAVTAGTQPGLYTSLDAGQTWTYNALADPGGATDATSATSVVFNASAGQFFAALRYHGFYSSPDGVTWTRLTTQPGGTLLNTTACPPQSTSNNYACPIYRGEITVVPGRNETYAWFVYFSSTGVITDGGIWQSLNGGASWTQISEAGITNCGDFDGCGVQQGSYNLELLAVPNATAGTDLYAGAINLYKCSINSLNPTCASSPFMNLTHVYGCDPIAAPSHVHPDQHALAYMIPTAGSDSGNDLMYFANDGGIYRALDGFSGLTTGSCTGTNLFDDLNQNLGSMTQFVSFSQHPTDANTLLGGTQDNGSPATSQATTNTAWINVLGGDGGYNAIDPNTPTNFYASNPDIPPNGLGIQFCSSGVNCVDSTFSFVVTSSDVGGDDGAFYFPYILDPQSSSAMLVGTCRVWRGPRAGGAYTVLSPNFDTLGSGTCSGSEVNLVRAIAAGGPTDSNGSEVVYATTDGFGPLDGPLSSPSGGHVWVTTNATAGVSSFTDVTGNGPQGTINPNQFPVSDVAIDSSDATGATAYVTVMGFTGGTGHVWKTTNFGATWIDFTANLPDSPANAVVVYPAMSNVYVATDVGVFTSSTSSANWTEVGPTPGPGQSGFLPNVAVTALGTFASGGQQLLRASTYGRGVWQFNLVATPDFDLSISNSPQTVVAGQNATFDGSATAQNGYSSSVILSCIAGVTSAPSTCTPSPSVLTPAINTPFTVTASGPAGDYYFNVQGVGSDANQTTQQAAAVLHVLGVFALSQANPFPTVNAGSITTTTNGPIGVSANSGFTGTITLTCSLVSGSGSCSVIPSTVTTIPSTLNVTVNATALSVGSYQLLVQGTSGTETHSLVIPFNVGDYQLSGSQSLTVGLGAQVADNLTITASTYYSGKINATCDASSLPGATCTLNPANPISVSIGSTASLIATVAVPSTAALGTYNIKINTQDTTGAPSHSFTLALTVVQNFGVTSSTTSQTVIPGQTTPAYNLTIQPVGSSFSGTVTLSCTAGLPPGAKCLFSPSASVTPGNASVPVAMTISTGISTAATTYSITITATSGSLSYSLIVFLVVSKNFQLTVVQNFPTNADLGSSQTATVSVMSNYTGSINATCNASAMPGASCAVTQASTRMPANLVPITANTPLTLTVTLGVPSNATPASNNIILTVSDSSGQPNYTLYLPITLQDFSLTSATSSQTVSPGQTTGRYNLTIQTVGASFTDAVTLSCSAGLPAGAVCLFSPSSPVTPGSSAQAVAMTISTSASTGTGTYTVTVTGTSGSVSHSTTVSLTLATTVVGHTFSLALIQAFPATVTAGSSQTAKVSLTANYGGSVTATCDASAMPGSICTVSPANPIAISAKAAVTLTVTLALPNTAAPKAYSIGLTVTDSSGNPSHTLQPPLAFTLIEDFSLTSATPSQTVAAGQTTGAYQLSIAPNPPGYTFSGAVTLSCPSGLPGGAQCLFSPSAPQIPGSSGVSVVMTISTSSTTASSSPSAGHRSIFYALWLLLFGIVISWRGRELSSQRRKHVFGSIAAVFLAAASLLSCAGVSNSGNSGGGSGSNPTTYVITVAGTSGNLSQSITVQLVVQ
jgi:uncharacterized membrane protein